MEESLRHTLNEYYLEFFNDYLTVEKFAEHKGLPLDMAKNIIEAGRYVHDGNHPDY